jgi:hypothetical protein
MERHSSCSTCSHKLLDLLRVRPILSVIGHFPVLNISNTVRSLIKLNVTITAGTNCKKKEKKKSVDLYCFYETILESYRENLVALGVSHAFPFGSWEVTVAFNFISERTVQYYPR